MTHAPRKIIIDTDPGQDDAVAILLALASPEDLTVLGITAVAGNVPLPLTAKNARIICELAGKPETLVFAGCDRPLKRKLVTAEHVHGKTGLDGPQLADPAAVTFAVLWKQPAGVLAQLPNLKALQSYGAGIDSIVTDPDLPALPLARVIDPALTESMLRYLAGIESYYRLRLDQFNRQQQQALWKPKSPRTLQTLCVLGLGELGAATARSFQAQGYQVTGWSRTAKDIPGIRCFAGAEGLAPALRDADLVICLLPLTPATTQLLDQQVLALMKPGVIFYNWDFI